MHPTNDGRIAWDPLVSTVTSEDEEDSTANVRRSFSKFNFNVGGAINDIRASQSNDDNTNTYGTGTNMNPFDDLLGGTGRNEWDGIEHLSHRRDLETKMLQPPASKTPISMKPAHTQTSLMIHPVPSSTTIPVPHPVNTYGMQDIQTTTTTTPSEENSQTPVREEDPTTILPNTDTEDANSAPVPLPRRSKRIQDRITRTAKAVSLAALGIIYLFNSDVQPALLAHDLQNPCTDRIPTATALKTTLADESFVDFVDQSIKNIN